MQCLHCGCNHCVLNIDYCTNDQYKTEYYFKIYFKNGTTMTHDTTYDLIDPEWGTVLSREYRLNYYLYSNILTSDGCKIITWDMEYDIKCNLLFQRQIFVPDKMLCRKTIATSDQDQIDVDDFLPGEGIFILVMLQRFWKKTLIMKKDYKNYMRCFIIKS